MDNHEQNGKKIADTILKCKFRKYFFQFDLDYI